MKRFATLALAFLLLGSPLVADEMTEVYRQIYEQSDTLPQKYLALQGLMELGGRESAPVVAKALEELLRTQRNYTAASDKELLARAVRLTAQALGEQKYDEAAPFLWSAVQEMADPLTKAEALIALGRMRALDYAERISLLLRDLNLKPTADTDAGEKTAFGAIVALERLKDPRGFSPVFFAADAWYSLRIRQQAERSLPNLLADPTDAINEIVRLETFERRLRALKVQSTSAATLERKTGTAILALDLSHKQVPKDRIEARFAAEVRKLGLKMLIAYKAKAPEAVPVAQASFDNGFDDEERLLGLAALGNNGTDPAAIVLRDLILRLNQDVRNGLGDEFRSRMGRAAIENAGLTKNKLVKPALVLVASNDKWSGSVIAAAQAAAKEIP